MLAKVYVHESRMLFSSRIRWLPSDQLNLRPWHRRELLADAGWMAEDVLTDWIQRLDEHGRGLSAEGGRWLTKTPDIYIRELLTSSGDAGRPELWIRCADHPHSAELHDRIQLIGKVRDRVRCAAQKRSSAVQSPLT